MSSPSDMSAFVRAVELGGFSTAARDLGLTPSAISKLVTRLEDRLGVRLLNRTTRRLALTPEGEAYFHRSQRILSDINEAENEVASFRTHPRGLLRVNVGTAFGMHQLAPALPDFLARHPEIQVELTVTDRVVDLIEEGADIGIRLGALGDSSLVARRICDVERVVCASPAYLKRHGTPSEPEALMEHGALHVLSRTGEAVPWVLHRGKQQWEGVPPPRAIANSPGLLMAMAVRGAGIVVATDHFALDHVRRKELTCVLPDWRPAPVSAWAVFPGRRLMPAKTRAFVDALAQHFSGPECQAVETKLRAARKAQK